MNEGVDTSIYPSAAELRAWGMQINPSAVPAKGMLPLALVKAWDKAHPDRPYRSSENFHGTVRGYAERGCHCDRCLETGRRDRREKYRARAEERWMGDLA